MTDDQRRNLLQTLPAVGKLLEHEEVSAWLRVAPRTTVLDSLRSAVELTRRAILDGRTISVDEDTIVGIAEHTLSEALRPSLVKVINATGIILHTGLGRAPLCSEAIEAIAEAASGYCNLEYDLSDGERGQRATHVTGLLRRLTGAEAATVVNNNAAATVLILKVLAEGREVIVSRGQLVEIGGSFRLPDIMSASGAILREVGTTNRTRVSDYSTAITDECAALMRVHPSNYRLVGFAEEASLDDLVLLAQKHGLLMIDDVGSGLIAPTAAQEAEHEPVIRDSITAGADVVCFSGDKLLGGPQCGIIVGKRNIIDRLEQHPLMRTYRVDKLTLLALEATLRHWTDADHAAAHLPTLAMLTAPTDTLLERARELERALVGALPDERFLICSATGFAGGGSLPGSDLESVVVQWKPSTCSSAEAARRLRSATVPVIARVHDDAIHFDVRTIADDDYQDLIEGVSSTVDDVCSPLNVLNG